MPLKNAEIYITLCALAFISGYYIRIWRLMWKLEKHENSKYHEFGRYGHDKEEEEEEEEER